MPTEENFESGILEFEDERLLRMLAVEAYKEEAEKLDAFEKLQENVLPNEEQEKVFWKFIRQQEHAERVARGRLKGKRLGRLFLVAAVLVGLLSAVSVFASRWNIFGFMSENYGEYSHMWGKKNGVETKPNGWESDFFPLWIPEGFEISDILSYDGAQILIYKNQSREFSFEVLQNSDNYFENTEGMITVSVSINGQTTDIYTTPDGSRSCYSLHQENEIIAISGDLNVDEIVKIVENINSL